MNEEVELSHPPGCPVSSEYPLTFGCSGRNIRIEYVCRRSVTHAEEANDHR